MDDWAAAEDWAAADDWEDGVTGGEPEGESVDEFGDESETDPKDPSDLDALLASRCESLLASGSVLAPD